MGKIFLLAIVVGFVWSGYALVNTWRKQFGGAPKTEQQEKRGPQNEEKKTLVAEPEPAREEKPIILKVGASCAEWLYIRQWGFVEKGDELEDGSQVMSWSKVGSDWFAVLKKEGRLVKARFQRASEALRDAAQQFAAHPGPTPQQSFVPVEFTASSDSP